MNEYEVLSWVLAGLFSPLLLGISPCYGFPGSNINQTFVNPNPDEPFLHMIVDTEPEHGLGSGRVYVGAVNHLYQLTAELAPSVSVAVGPVMDSEKCPPSGQCDQTAKVATDNYIKAMAIYKRNGKLIVCGSVQQGSCRMHHLYNVSIMDDPVRAVVANDKVSSSVIFVGPGKDSTQVLNVGSTYTKAVNYWEDVPAVATLKLDPPSEMFSYVYKGVHEASYIKLDVTKRELHKITYITGFTSKTFTYFLTQQPEQENRYPGDLQGYQVKSSKIIRICQADTKYYSYTEVPLKCTSKAASGRVDVDYNLLQAAYKTKPGYDLAQNMGLTTEDEVLFAVFRHGNDGRSGDQSSPFSHQSSALCIYSMKQVEQIFLDNIKICAQGGTNRGLDFIKKERECTRMRFRSDDLAACGSEVNYPLGGRIPVESEPAWKMDGRVATSVLATTVHSHTVVFVGTGEGELRKVVVDKQTEGKEFGNIEMSIDHQPILQDMSFDVSTKFLYAMTGRALYKVGVNRCSEYRGCTACLNANDPYCGWCSQENRCSEKVNCDNLSWLSFETGECTAITKINPDKLPINKADYLKISVQNLPDVEDLMCVFEFPGSSEPVSTNATRHNASEIECSSAPHMPEIPAGKHHMESTLSIAMNRDGTPFASTNFTFFDCSSFASCTACVSSDFPCDWCPQSAKCTHKAEEVCLGEKLINGINRALC